MKVAFYILASWAVYGCSSTDNNKKEQIDDWIVYINQETGSVFIADVIDPYVIINGNELNRLSKDKKSFYCNKVTLSGTFNKTDKIENIPIENGGRRSKWQLQSMKNLSLNSYLVIDSVMIKFNIGESTYKYCIDNEGNAQYLVAQEVGNYSSKKNIPIWYCNKIKERVKVFVPNNGLPDSIGLLAKRGYGDIYSDFSIRVKYKIRDMLQPWKNNKLQTCQYIVLKPSLYDCYVISFVMFPFSQNFFDVDFRIQSHRINGMQF